MASIPREIQKKHNKLLVDLCDYIHIEDRWYTNFITFLRNADLPPGQLSHVENEPAKLFQLMEQKGKLKVGDYGVLEEAFENSGNEEALSLVRRLGCEITKQIKEQGPTTSSVAEKTAQKNDKSPNKRKRTAAQETILERDNSPNKQRKIEPRDDKDIPREDYYDRENKRGYLLILNFTKDREGTELDVSNLKKFFEKTLNFDVDDPREDRQSDFSLSELNKVLEQARNLLNFRAKKLYCFFCAILSHGDETWFTESTLTILNDGAITRLNPVDGTLSTIDLTLLDQSDPMGSDHFPIIATLQMAVQFKSNNKIP
ncbi:hypothetical protein ACJMK2_039827, partial [Sinanodonta woodiana]